MVLETFVDEPVVVALAVLVLGLIVGFIVGRINEELLRAAGVGDAVEGTPF